MTPAWQGEEREVRWGLPDVFIGVVVSWVAAVVVLLAILALSGQETGGETGTGSYVGRYGVGDALGVERVDPALPLWTLPVGQLGLWAGLAVTAVVAATRRGNGLRRDFGWSMRASDVPIGLAFGVFAQVVVVWLIYAPFQLVFDFDVSEAARAITDRAATPGDIALVMLGVVVGAPIFEELFFRGLALRAFERRWGPVAGVLASSVLFGAVHLQLLQFPALVAFAIIAAMLVRRYGRLGPAIWAHIGFNLVAVVNLIWLIR
ncbi:CPBP family intramembrane glutamic endopeptidase [Candidatus Poriferisocius sp.]|uniref:CPBP family intramembrane glutamic endopeptidase n=1 Tax=Candidatus Poriferisocius sp. TaxID=3101276 RepID=UPI003B0134FA